MIIGITGGIGSGKSLVTDYLSNKYGFLSIKTDDLAREMMNSEVHLKTNLIHAFGNSIYGIDGKLDKAVYASIIHSDPSMREKSDQIVHPAVWNKVRQLTADGKDKEDTKIRYAVETALPGSSLKKLCDELWYVHSNTDVRIQRLMVNRSYTREYAEAVIKGQISEDAYTSLADRIIENNSTLEDLYLAVDKIISEKIPGI